MPKRKPKVLETVETHAEVTEALDEAGIFPRVCYQSKDWSLNPQTFYDSLLDTLDLRLGFGCGWYMIAEVQHTINHFGSVWYECVWYMRQRPVN